MAHRIKANVWTSRLAHLSYAALLVMIFGLSVAAQAQDQREEAQTQEQGEEAQAQEQDEEAQTQEQDEEAQAQEQDEEAQAQEPAEIFAETVVVIGVRESLTQAVEVKRDAIPIVDALVAEDIGKFPDNNVVESMQRIPGVQVTNRGGGEVSTISIRGLADVTTTVNGRNVFTSSGRAVALADIPATLVNRVDVYKTRSPENIARGIAGGIDIHTFRPFDFAGYTFSGSARG
ncbi:MAG TPA: TonB-dependent receptor plug domain-containing protein, partial [Thermoanaerobaculia bacterium]